MLLALSFPANSFSQKDSANTKMSFDLGLTRGGRHNINLMPVFKRVRTKDLRETEILFPFYGIKHNYVKHTKSSHLFPIYLSDSTANTHDFRFLTVYYPSILHVSGDKSKDLHSVKFIDLAPEINFMEFTRSKDGRYVQNNMLFFFWYGKDQVKQTSHLIFFPLYWSFQNKENYTRTLFPLFLSGTYDEHRGKYLAVTPFYWHLKKDDLTRDIFFPFWWSERSGSNGNIARKNTVFPIYWSHTDKESSSKVIFPFIWSFSNQQYHSFTVFPLYSKKVSADGSYSRLMITPFFWETKDHDRQKDVLFPLWWHSKWGTGENAGHTDVLFPFYRAYKDKQRSSNVLFPFIWSFTNPQHHSLTIFPVYSKTVSTDGNHSRLMFTPLFWETKDHDKLTDILFPVWWRFKSGSGENASNFSTLFPIFWSYKAKGTNNTVIFPFIWDFNNPKFHSYTVFPLFSVSGATDNSFHTLMITPLFWQKRNLDDRSTVLFPIAWFTKKKIAGWTNTSGIMFPLYWSYKSTAPNGHTTGYKILFPFVWKINDVIYSSFTFFPFYSKGISFDSTSTHEMITPLFWHFKNHENISTVLFPLWWYTKTVVNGNAKYTSTLFPLYWHFKDHLHERDVLFPLYWHYTNGLYSTTSIFPFFSGGKSLDGSLNHLMITPLFWKIRNGDRKWDIFFPFYYSYKDKIRDRKVVFPLIWIIKDTAYQTVSIAPLISTGHSHDNRTAYTMASPLFWHFKNPNGYSYTFFPLWWYSKKGTGDNEFKSNILFPLWWSYKDKEKNNKIFFPLVWSLNNKNYHSFTIFPLLSTGHTPDGKYRHLMFTPLFWHFKNPDGYSNVLFPFLWNFRKGVGDNAENTNIIFPFYWSYKNKETDNKIFFPLVWSLNNSRYHSFTIFPLLSTGHTPDGKYSHLMFTPLFWHFKNPDGCSNVLFPFLWNFKKGVGDNAITTNILFPFWWSYKYKETNNKILFPLVWSLNNKYYHSFTIFPLLSTGHSPDGTYSHLMFTPLFWHFKNPDGSSNVLFPLLWNFRKGVGDNAVNTNIIFPFYWSYKDKETNNKIFFPLVWSLNNKYYHSFTIFPLLSTGHTPDGKYSHLMFTPLFWHFKNPDGSSNVLFPILWNFRKGVGDNAENTNILFPFYWSYKDKDRNKKILFPLLWSLNNNYYHSFTIFPLLSTGHTPDGKFSHLMFTPLLWHFKNLDGYSNILFPLWWNSKSGTGDKTVRTNVIFPLYWSFKNATKNNMILFPLVWDLRNAHYSSFTLLPLVSFGHSADKTLKYFVFTPVFWSIHHADSRRVTLFPFFSYYDNKSGVSDFNILYFVFHYRKETDKKVMDLLMPLCHFEKRTNYTYFRFAPLVWYKNSPKDKFFSIQPFYYHGKDSTSESYNIFWQLFTYQNVFNVKKSRNFLWKAVFSDKYNNGDHEFRILYFLYANMKKEGKTEHTLFPLYESSKDSTGYKYKSVFFYFYRSFSRKIEGTNEFYREVDLFWFLRFRSNYSQLKAKGIDEKKIRQ